eukprot:1801895-Amphidinium_carterae.1
MLGAAQVSSFHAAPEKIDLALELQMKAQQPVEQVERMKATTMSHVATNQSNAPLNHAAQQMLCGHLITASTG